MDKRYSLDSLCAAYAYALGVEPPTHAAPAAKPLKEYIDTHILP